MSRREITIIVTEEPHSVRVDLRGRGGMPSIDAYASCNHEQREQMAELIVAAVRAELKVRRI